MNYRRFGRTGLDMPVFSCGGMRYQSSWKDEDLSTIQEDNQRNLEATIHRALELGINHIETARGYGTSELQLGLVLPSLDRDRLIVQTKVAPNQDPAKFLETFELSMQRLQLEHVDLLSFHGVNTEEILDWVIRPGGCLETARQLQREGRVRFLGFSTHGPTRTIRRAINTGEFDYLNLHWYWINQSNWPAIEDATRLDMGVFIISPNDKGGKLYAPPPKLAELCQPLAPMEFNNLFCLLRPEVHTLSVGASCPGDFDLHVRSLERLDEAPTLVPEIDLRLQTALSDDLGADWWQRWQEGIPEWEQIPGDINVWEILRLWNVAKGLDMVDFANMRYNLLGNGGHWFPGLNAESFDEEALRAALSASPFCDQIPEILREAHTLLFEAPKKRLSEGD